MRIKKIDKLRTPYKTFRAKCMDCTQSQYDEIKYCQVPQCPIYPFRFGKKPTEDDTRIHLEAVNKSK